jgi:hypothetical protein
MKGRAPNFRLLSTGIRVVEWRGRTLDIFCFIHGSWNFSRFDFEPIRNPLAFTVLDSSIRPNRHVKIRLRTHRAITPQARIMDGTQVNL